MFALHVTRQIRLLKLIGALVACLALLPLPRAGAAATRYAAPDGDGPSPCLQSNPCDLETAVEFGVGGLANGDTVLLAPGTYHPAGSVEVFAVVTLSGEPGQPAPLIEAGGERGLYMQERSTVRDVRIHSSAGTGYGFVLLGEDSVAERVESTGEAGAACICRSPPRTPPGFPRRSSRCRSRSSASRARRSRRCGGRLCTRRPCASP
jgi:hypothetical protein